MDRGDWLAVILLILFPIPFISSHCLITFSAKFMNETREKEISQFGEKLILFRKRQLISAIYTGCLFCFSFGIIAIFSKLNNIQGRWLDIFSALILTHAVFGKLGWEIQSFSGDTVLEVVNEWWFRVLYSIGIILLFIAMMR